jgi:hypothetical protein
MDRRTNRLDGELDQGIIFNTLDRNTGRRTSGHPDQRRLHFLTIEYVSFN